MEDEVARAIDEVNKEKLEKFRTETQNTVKNLAHEIYRLDEEVYKQLGSSLGRVFSGDKKREIHSIISALNDPDGYKIRNDLVLISNMARTIKNKNMRKSVMQEYSQILKKVRSLPESFAGNDIMDYELAGLNQLNLKTRFASNHTIICIGRTYGSGGTDIGFALADKLHINYYDAEVIKESENILEALENEKKKNFLSRVIYDFGKYHGLAKEDAQFFKQSELILEKALTEDFVIMGRCADKILTNNHIPHISIFITAPFEIRAKRIASIKHNISLRQARKLLKKIDAASKRHYRNYTLQRWGDIQNYDLCINSACFGIEGSVELILRSMNR